MKKMPVNSSHGQLITANFFCDELSALGKSNEYWAVK